MPVELTVWPFELAKIDDITISVTGSKPGVWRTWYPDLEEKWWRMAEAVMANQAAHGMNAVTGGPGAVLKAVKDGKAVIDYTDFDRWLGLAVKHGLTMPVSIAHVNDKAMALVRKGGRQIWDYSGTRVRHDIGRWAFVAARAGLKGFLRNGYMYVCSDPYFDFSDDEGSWAVVYPSRAGLNDTVGWERTADGVDDYRYLLTCERLVRKARAAGKAGPAADAAAAYMAKTLAPIKLSSKASAALTPAEYDEFKRALAGHIVAMTKALEQ